LDWESARVTWALALWALTPLIAGVILNLLVNPFRLYWSELFDPATANTRLAKYEMITELPTPPRSLIIGSSHVMTMEPAEIDGLLGDGPCFNFGMPSAMAEDYLAALRLVVEDAGAPLEHVILGLDFPALHPRLPLMYEGRYFPQFRRYVPPGMRGPPLWLDRLTMLISAEQTEESLNVLRRRVQHRLSAPNVELNPDGSAVLVMREQAIRAGRFDLDRVLSRRLRHFDSYSLHLATFTEPSAERLDCIRQVLDYCYERGIDVHAYLTPLHPRQWELLGTLPQAGVLDECTAELEALFSGNGEEFRDYSHIASFGGDPALFYDEQHVMPENQRRIAELLLGEDG
jgi:hypothetical protein